MWRAFLRSLHQNEFLRKVVIEYRIPSFPCNIIFNWICFFPQMFWLLSIPPPTSCVSSRRSSVQQCKSCETRNDSSLGTKVELLGSIWWQWMKFFPSFCVSPQILVDSFVIFLFLQVSTLPCRHEILRWDSLSLRWIPASEWVLGIRSLFLVILLNHLHRKKQIRRLCGLSGILSHSVF